MPEDFPHDPFPATLAVAHPGEVLKEYLGDRTVAETAVKLGVTRATLSRIVSCTSGISVNMAYRWVRSLEQVPSYGQACNCSTI